MMVGVENIRSGYKADSVSALQRMPCASCGKELDRQEVKFVLPSFAFGSRSMPTTSRLLCSSCFRRYATRRRSMVRQAARHRFVQSLRLARSITGKA